MSDREAEFAAALERDLERGEEVSLDAYLERFPGPVQPLAQIWFEQRAEAASADLSSPGSGGMQLGPYRLESELGRGGQGAVWLATDSRLGRKVALKVLTGFASAQSPAADRLRREAEVVARLDHPAICGVFDVGQEGGTPFIAMRYIEGRTLSAEMANLDMESFTANSEDDSTFLGMGDQDDASDDGGFGVPPPNRQTLAEVIGWFEEIARGLHVAHEAGIVHRDIKPGNIMITEDRRPVILDFGLARDDESGGATLTQSGELFGSPAYMSPEQLLSKHIAVDRGTDIWSVGVALYECVTGQRPFDGPTRHGIYRAIATREPEDPRRRNPSISRDLAVVVMTALQKDRDRRFATALDMAEDLARIRRNLPIKARPVSSVERFVRAVRRRPTLSALIALIVTAIPVVTGLIVAASGSEARARLASEKAEVQVALRERIEEETQALVHQARATAFRNAVESAGVEMGILSFAMGGKAAYERTAGQYMAAYRRADLALDDAGPIQELIERYRTELEADPRLGRELLAGLYDLSWMLPAVDAAGNPVATPVEAPSARGLPVVQSPIPATPEWIRIAVRIDRLLEAVEPNSWFSEVRTVSRRSFEAGDMRLLAEFVDRQRIDELDASQLGLLGSISFAYLRDHERAAQLLDRALSLEPNSFLISLVRGSMEMRPPAKGETMRDRGAAAAPFLQVSLALRPKSGIAWAMIAQTRAQRGDPQGALRALDRATEFGGDSPVVWHFSGFLLAALGKLEDARAAFERAVAIDSRFTASQKALKALSEGRRPGLGVQMGQ